MRRPKYLWTELICGKCGGRSYVRDEDLGGDKGNSITPLGVFATYDGKTLGLPCGHGFNEADTINVPDGIAVIWGERWSKDEAEASCVRQQDILRAEIAKGQGVAVVECER